MGVFYFQLFLRAAVVPFLWLQQQVFDICVAWDDGHLSLLVWPHGKTFTVLYHHTIEMLFLCVTTQNETVWAHVDKADIDLQAEKVKMFTFIVSQ